MKILFIGLNWLGDVVMSLPAMIAAAEKHEVHVLTRPHLAEIYQLPGNIAAIHKVVTNGPFFSTIQKIRQLKSEAFDVTVVLPDSLRAAMIAWLLRNRSIGYKTQARGVFLSRTIEKPENFKCIHEAVLHFDLVKNAGLADKIAPLPAVKFSESEFIAVANKLAIDPSRPYYVLAPGAAFGAAKRWPTEGFAKVANLITQLDMSQVLVTGSNTEKQITESISGKNGTIKSIAGMTGLYELAILLSRAKALLANDSGTMHLAALFNTPTVVPVGPTDMIRTGSLSKNARYVFGTEKCPIAPCRQKTCSRGDHICMSSISAEMVFSTLKELGGQKE